jgi:hypothetical protein
VQLADNSVMVSSKDAHTVVQVASYDMAIVDNSIVARQVSGAHLLWSWLTGVVADIADSCALWQN